MSLDSPVAVATGAARGIGLATARLFLERDYRVALVAIDGDTLARTDHELADGAPNVHHATRILALVCDVADPPQVSEAFRRIDATFGRIDVLFNAGIAIFKPILETSYDEWSRVAPSIRRWRNRSTAPRSAPTTTLRFRSTATGRSARSPKPSSSCAVRPQPM